jgi:hypothetical protein
LTTNKHIGEALSILQMSDFPSGCASIGFLENDFDRVGAAAALCGAAQRGIDAAHAQTRRLACNSRSQLAVAKDIARAYDHAALLTEDADKDRCAQRAQQHSAPDPDEADEGRRRHFCAARTQRRLSPAGSNGPMRCKTLPHLSSPKSGRQFAPTCGEH